MALIGWFNTGTGEVGEVDTDEARLVRLRSRIGAWTAAVNSISDKFAVWGLMLTYRPGVKWAPKHISRYIKSLRASLGADLLGYTWVAELQKRGAVHYHLCLITSPDVRPPHPDRVVNGAAPWPHGISGVRRLKKASGKYLAKYLQKGADLNHGQFPKGLRLFACSIRKDLLEPERDHALRASATPGFLRRVLSEKIEEFNVIKGWVWRRMVGGGFWLSNKEIARSWFIFSPVRVRVIWT